MEQLNLNVSLNEKKLYVLIRVQPDTTSFNIVINGLCKTAKLDLWPLSPSRYGAKRVLKKSTSL